MKIIFIMMSFFLVLMIPSSTIIHNEPTYHLVLESTIEGPLEVGTFDPTYYYFIKSDPSGYEEIIPLTYDHFSPSDLDKLKAPGLHQLTITHEAQTFHLNVLMTAPVIPSLMEQIYQKGIEEDVIDMTYEEWLLSIKGETGRSIVDAHINQEGLLHLTFCDGEVKPLVNVIGPQGEEAPIIEMNLIDDQIQWRYLNEEWNPLIAMDDLKGLRGLRGYTGSTGATGETPEIRVFEGFLQSKAPSSETWENILDLNTLKPDAARSISDASVNQNGDLIITYSDGSTHLAGSIPKIHTVILVGIDGNVLDFQTVSHGGNARTMIPPIVEGYQFSQWSRAMTNITQDTLIKAEYTLNQVTLSFNTLGGSNVDPITIDYGTSVNLPTPTKEGFVFKGWFYGESIHDQQLTHQSSILENITVFARWDVEIYNVIFAVDGSILQQTYTLYNQEVIPPDNPTKVGFEFIGWNHTSSAVTADLWIEARFEVKSIHLSYQSIPHGYDGTVGTLNLGDSIEKIELGSTFSGALNNQGDLYLWGSNAWGQLGTGNYINVLIPTLINPYLNLGQNETVIDFALGHNHTLILTSNHKVYAVGSNSQGQLGIESPNFTFSAIEITSTFDLEEDVITKLYAKANHSGAISHHYQVFMWGDNANGLIGEGTLTSGTFKTPVNITHQFDLMDDVISSLHLGISFNAALSDNKQLFTWGRNTSGQLGTGDTVNANHPILISEPFNENSETIENIALGADHMIVSTFEKTIYTWGHNLFGQLGNGITSMGPQATPVDITSQFESLLGQSIDVYAESGFTVVILDQSKIYGFGNNHNTTYDLGSDVSSNIPKEVTSQYQLVSLIKSLHFASNSSSPFQILLDESSQLIAWGTNVSGQLGDNTTALGVYPTYPKLFTPIILKESTYLYTDELISYHPSLEGYTFSGWYTDMELTTLFNEITMPEEDITLYAKWELKSD